LCRSDTNIGSTACQERTIHRLSDLEAVDEKLIQADGITLRRKLGRVRRILEGRKVDSSICYRGRYELGEVADVVANPLVTIPQLLEGRGIEGAKNATKDALAGIERLGWEARPKDRAVRRRAGGGEGEDAPRHADLSH